MATCVKMPLAADSPELPNSSVTSKHVLIVMDALKNFSMKPLQWALDHVTCAGDTVTVLGAMPWLNRTISCGSWLDAWGLNLQDLNAIKESERNSDAKYQKVREIIELCEKYGVVLNIKAVMGYPLRLVILEETMNLHAKWVVFNQHIKHQEFYAKKLPCNVVMINSDGEVDIVKVQPMDR